MKSGFKTLSLSFILSLFTAFSFAQALTPQPSSGQTIIQDFGLGKVTLTYSRPDAKGRDIFGGLVPYGQVWRTGANSATTITFTDEVNFGGKQISAGTYGLFTIPNQNEWTIILNKTSEQWGAYTYKAEDDVIRVNIQTAKSATKTETFTIQFSNVTPGKLDLDIVWDKTKITVPITVDFDTKVMANIAKAMTGEKKPYFAAAQYYYSNNKDLKQALVWMNEAEKTGGKAPWLKLWKGKIQQKMGDKKAAKISATEGLAIAKEINNPEYIKLNQALLDELK